jgi:H/ACA ribonucleoprotein complex non-core subunit NAF1
MAASGFQIPGLGFAKPNEKLPPLPLNEPSDPMIDDSVQKSMTNETGFSSTQDDSTTAGRPTSQQSQSADTQAPEDTEMGMDGTIDTSESDMAVDIPQSQEASRSTKPPLPLPTDLAAAASVRDAIMQDQNEHRASRSDGGSRSADVVVNESGMQEQNHPPTISILGALEAAIGGLGPRNEAAEQAGADEAEHPEWEADSSPYESSSESTTDSSDSESDNEAYGRLGVEETARLLMMEVDGGSDDENDNRNGRSGASNVVRTKNELAEDTAPKPDVIITTDMKILELGAVDKIVENTILIKAFTPGEYQVLDTGSVLCTADRSVIAAVAETIGKVQEPMYTAIFPSEEERKASGVEVGTKVYYSVGHAKFVFTQPLKNLKGSDASNLHDEEVGDDEMEFSDDEKEAEYKRGLKKKKEANRKKSERGGREPHQLRKETKAEGSYPTDGLNYDEDDDGPYKPLARPAGYGQGQPPPEEFVIGSRGDFRGRSRGRGDRGRGDRSRGFLRGRGRGGRGGHDRRDEARDGYSLPSQALEQNLQYQQQSQWSGSFPQAPPRPAQHPFAAAGPTAASFNFPFIPPPIPQTQPSAYAGPGQSFNPPPPPGWPTQQFPLVPVAASGGSMGDPLAPVHDAAPMHGAYLNHQFVQAFLSQVQAQQAQGSQKQPWPPQQRPPSNGNERG